MKCLILVLASLAVMYQPVLGNCQHVTPVNDFDILNFTGNWFQYAQINHTYDVNTKCFTIKITYVNGTASFLNQAIDVETGKSIETEGYLLSVGDGLTGALDVLVPSESEATKRYDIIGTDYNNWAAVYYCRPISNVAVFEHAWILTRTREPSQDVITEAFDAIKAQNINTEKLTVSDQTDCDARF